MSSTLIALIPLALLGTVALLGFAGCALTHAGPMPIMPFVNYRGTVLGTSGLVACWPLGEAAGATTATDVGSNHLDGTYTAGETDAPYDMTNRSAAASGAVTPGQPGIVPGDAAHGPSTCPLLDGGFVSIPWDARINTPPFTLEAWVRPTWTDQDVASTPAVRGVVVSLDNANNTGFGLFATEDNYWMAVFGTGAGGLVSIRPPDGSNQKIMLNTTSYLVLTFDGTTATLYVNPAETTMNYRQGTVSGFVPLPSPTPTYIGAGRPNAPPPPHPGFPFTGFIQDVAIYNTVLDAMTIQTHYLNGNGMSMG